MGMVSFHHHPINLSRYSHVIESNEHSSNNFTEIGYSECPVVHFASNGYSFITFDDNNDHYHSKKYLNFVYKSQFTSTNNLLNISLRAPPLV
jgi:hypothetical protein